MLLIMTVHRRIAIGGRLTYSTAPHPDWRPNPEWPDEVGCVLYVREDALVLVDPPIRDDLDQDAWRWLDEVVGAARLRVVVLLTAPWHERSTRAFVARYGAEVWAARPARSRIADLTQLDNLPAGIAAFAPGGVDEGQVAFVFEEERTIVVAEFLLGTPSGLEVLPAPATSDLHELLESLQELERLPIERVLVSHGPPVLNRGREAIAAALRSFQDAR